MEDPLQVEENFKSFLATIALFIDQDPYSGVAMNLDVNYRRGKQENFTAEKGKDIQKAILEKDGSTFQNSPIHLLFYEKIEYTDSEPPPSTSLDLSSLSWCKLNHTHFSISDPQALELELRLVLCNVTAKYVSKDHYEELLFVLGQRPHISPGQNCKEILKLFSDFPTHTVHNFKEMIH